MEKISAAVAHWNLPASRASRSDFLLTVVRHYLRIARSRRQWVGFASQSLFFNPYLAAMDMFFVHPGAAHGLASRGLANVWAALGTCGVYSTGRDALFHRLGLTGHGRWHDVGAIAADTVFGFLMNLPGFVVNYLLSGCGWAPSLIMGLKASASASWTSPVSGVLFDTFFALDSAESTTIKRAPKWVRWGIIDRTTVGIRRKLIWSCLAVSICATLAIYFWSPAGLFRR